ncbi:hypothetical protein H310_05228 [Aphanomyces invadans]|uniref:Uncharacterized protein n=1 Tax=Aphanomyces invadans TaxID=157072 RepID=A0A024UA08_9STRA|nr:hypothetical protein H310_05228 [Aphanomyces invadans]ETW02727.1 hypothetical protein H310_05228 [Aphanomyces invadans]|eukprot:XP_008868111.1 hypothetical protein H310_05228 [Aphanomyces invadans]
MNANKETRIQFLSSIFEHVVSRFKDKIDAESFRLFAPSKLVGQEECHVYMDDKKYDINAGTVHAVLAMKAAAG